MPKSDTQFKKGSGGRPKGTGRPTLKTLISSLPKDLREFKGPNGEVLNANQLGAWKLLEALQKGRDWAVKEFLSHTCGKPVQAVELEANIADDRELTDAEIKERIAQLAENLGGIGGVAKAPEDPGSEDKPS